MAQSCIVANDYGRYMIERLSAKHLKSDQHDLFLGNTVSKEVLGPCQKVTFQLMSQYNRYS